MNLSLDSPGCVLLLETNVRDSALDEVGSKDVLILLQGAGPRCRRLLCVEEL
jgi:hypothetical protein